MSNRRIVFTAVIIVIAVATILITLSSTVDNREIPQPPSLTLRSDHRIINGVLGDYCWKKQSNHTCMDKLPPTQLTTRAALMTTRVTSNQRLSFQTSGGSEPQNLTYRIINTETGQSRHQSISTFTIQQPGPYLIVASAEWQHMNATYTYQLQVG